MFSRFSKNNPFKGWSSSQSSNNTASGKTVPAQVKSKKVTPNRLCEVCTDICGDDAPWRIPSKKAQSLNSISGTSNAVVESPTSQDKKIFTPYLRHHHVDSLEKSADQGCHLCSLILGGLRTSSGPYRDLTPELGWDAFGPYVLVMFDMSIDRLIIVSPPEGHKYLWKPSVELYYDTYTAPLFKQDLTYENSSDETIQKILEWTETCGKLHHDHCDREVNRSGNRSLPSRLLHVTDFPKHLRVRIVNGPELALETKYLTLSYRWGGDSILELTKDSEAMLRKGIVATLLPKTIQDAVWMTRKLGFQYLWVDALCIIQDSKEDWLVESANMCNVYMNAQICISASTADPTKGILRRRNPLLKTPYKMTTYTKPGQRSFRLIVRPFGELEFTTTGREDPVGRFDLYSRGWVLQERLLSPRILHFTDVEVIWECNTTQCSEVYPINFAQADLRRLILKQWIASPRATTEYQLVNLDRISMWQEVVMQYSGLQLTYETDRLAALAGLASRVHDCWGDSLGNYVAGLFDADIIRHLCWRSLGLGPSPSPPKNASNDESIAPTWSWASVKGAVTYDNAVKIDDRIFMVSEPDRFDCIKTLRVHTNSDQIHRPRTGEPIQLEGCLFSMKMKSINRTDDTSQTSSISFLDQHTFSSLQDYDMTLDARIPNDSLQTLGEYPFYALPITVTSVYKILMLRPENKGCPGRYARMGYLTLQRSCGRLLAASYPDQPKLDEVLYEACGQAGLDILDMSTDVTALRYTISIV